MFPKFRKIYSLSLSSLVIIMFLLEFHPTCFRVKDLKSQKLLLQGPSRGGLYPWPSLVPRTRSPLALLGERVSLNKWHSRLGHPALRVVRRVLSSHQLLVTSNKATSICSSCQQGKLYKFHFPVTPRLLQKGVSEFFFLFSRDITTSSEL